ncbi:hypothetical protein KPL74_02650 [Bacillus sp. NP157]|nr:hypothetical protein KPL74_02650 [Bacillus sp. NP157]
MSIGDLYPAAHVERGDGFAMQATTHWLRLVPGRTLFCMKAGGLPVSLPDLPDAVRHRGLEVSRGDHQVGVIDVSSDWLRDHAELTDRYAALLRPVLTDRRARLDGYTKHVALNGTMDLFLGPNLDRVNLDLEDNDGSYAIAIDLLKHAPAEGRTAFAMPPAAGSSRYEDPDFLAGTQSWIDGRRLLIEFPPEEGGRAETVAIDRGQFLAALERCWPAMAEVAARIRAILRGAL